MKKKIYTLLFLLIFCFSFFVNVNPTLAFYEYRNSDGKVTSVCGFTDILNCSSKLEEICGSNTSALCVLSNYDCDYQSLSTDPICPQVQTVDPNKDNNTADDTYNLLAPIPGLEEAASTNDIGKYFNIIFEIVIGICAVLAVVMIVIGGIEYMGDESVFGKTEAKSRIKKALLGLIIVLGAYALLNTINPDLLGGGGVNIRQVTAEIEDGNQYRLLMTQNTPEAKTFKRTSYYEQIKTIATNKGIPHCLVQVAIQRESGGRPSIGHDEDVPFSAIPSRRSFVASGKKFNGTTFQTTGENDKKITQKSFKNTDHPNNYLLPPNQNTNDLGLDWRFSHSVGLFGVTFGPNHLAPSGAKNIFTNSNADIQKATDMMKAFYNKCNKNIEETWRAYNSGRCDGNNSFTNKEAPIRVNLYNQCISQDN